MSPASGSFLHPTAIALWLLLISVCAESLTSFLFLRGLRKHHTKHWVHSGERSPWTDWDLISAWATVRYLQRRLYLHGGADAGVAYCERHRVPVVMTYWFAVIAAVAFFLSLLIKGWPHDWR